MLQAKKLLKSIRKKRFEVSLLVEQKQILICPKAITYDRVRVQTSPQDRMLETVMAIQSLEDKLEKEIHDLMMDEIVAFSLIYTLDDPVYRQVLILYYLSGSSPKSWNNVADLLGYSESRVKHINGWALAEMEKHMNDSTPQHSPL